MKKRGLSDVVTAVLIILLALAAVAVIWVVLSQFLKSSGENLSTDELASRFSLPANALVTIDRELHKISFVAKRDAGESEIAGFNVILKDSSGTTEVKRANAQIKSFETAKIEVPYTLPNIASIAIAPIYRRDGGKEVNSSQETTRKIQGWSESIQLGQTIGDIQYQSPGLAGYWKFDSISTSGSLTITPDSSENAQTATLANTGELVKNGGFEFSTSNWGGTISITQNEKNSGAYSAEAVNYQQISSKEFIPIELTNKYTLEGSFKSYGSSDSYLYFGYIPYDEKKQQINSPEVYVIFGTETTLYSAINPGDTKVKLTSCNNWNVYPGGYDYRVIAFNTDNSGNYNDLPNREYHRGVTAVNKLLSSYCEITLSKPIPSGKSYPAGTKVREHTYGGTYIYSINTYVPATWTKYTGNTKGNGQYGGITGKWWPGTKFVKILILANYGGDSSIKTRIDDISLKSTPPIYTGASWADGKREKALSFDGYDDYLTIPNNNALDLTTSFSTGFWINKKSGGKSVISKDGLNEDTTGAYNIYVNDDGSVTYETNNQGAVNTLTGSVPLDTWHQVMVTFDNSASPKMRLYVDGIEKATGNPAAPTINTKELLIGRRGYASGDSITGVLDEIIIYKRALSSEEVKNYYESTK